MKLMQALILAGAIGASGLAAAHDDAYLANLKAPHGGQLRMAGPYHFELVLARDAATPAERPVFLYVTDHAGTKVSTGGASGTALILSGAAKATVSLEPHGENGLKGIGRYAAGSDAKAVVSVSFPDKATEQARFSGTHGR